MHIHKSVCRRRHASWNKAALAIVTPALNRAPGSFSVRLTISSPYRGRVSLHSLVVDAYPREVEMSAGRPAPLGIQRC